MIEKVNPSHPDKVADRIAGAIVDLAYKKTENPKIAVEVLIGHGKCHIICETSEHFTMQEVTFTVLPIAGAVDIDYIEVPQDAHLAANQEKEARCGDNGIFKGVPISFEERTLSEIVREWYEHVWPSDGKFIYDEPSQTFIACQSNANNSDIAEALERHVHIPLKNIIVNPLGEWTGGTNVDTGATNRKLGSDMGRAVTGGGLHGKDLSKADVAVNIACHIMAQEYQQTISALCAIGDDKVGFKNADGITTYLPYADVVEMARGYINTLGGFEKLAEWGLF